MIIPKKIKYGDHLRVISPSRSLAIISKDVQKISQQTLEGIGLSISYSKNSTQLDQFNSSSIEARLDDLHEAFINSSVNGILTSIGGFNCNQLLPYINFELIKKNPKVLCGYSDISTLLNAIYAKTGIVSYYGPHFSTFGVRDGNQFTIEYFKKCVFEEPPFIIKSSKKWSDDEWYINQDQRNFISNTGMQVLQPGSARGTLIGGNLDTFNLLQGTPYMPVINGDVILFIEEDNGAGENFYVEFDRNLESILQQDSLKNITGLLMGRIPKGFEQEVCNLIMRNKPRLKSIPIVTNIDSSHTLPLLTLPIGGLVEMNISENSPIITITDH